MRWSLRTKIRAELSSNGSEVAGCRFHPAQKSELSSHQMVGRDGGLDSEPGDGDFSPSSSPVSLRFIRLALLRRAFSLSSCSSLSRLRRLRSTWYWAY